MNTWEQARITDRVPQFCADARDIGFRFASDRLRAENFSLHEALQVCRIAMKGKTVQLSLDFARRQRDRGMALAEQGAINACEDWPDLALAYLRLYATKNGARFTAEDVLEAADAWGLIAPPNDRAWGPVFRRAAKAGLIVKDGTGVCRKRHASICVAWRSLVCAR